MYYLNLDPNFKPFKGNEIDFKSLLFPSKCELNIKIQPPITKPFGVIITTRIKSSDDVMMVLMATDALKRLGIDGISLFIPYLPYARQDRVMTTGEPLSLNVFASLINAQKYERVFCFDPHSDVAAAVIDNLIVINNHTFVGKAIEHFILTFYAENGEKTDFDKDFYLVSPDAGAYKKIYNVAKHVNFKGEIVICNKNRDVSNGVIRSVMVSHNDLKGKHCIIIDDICDGGGTFALLAEELKKRNADKVILIVSHGIFSKGFAALQNIDCIYYTDSFANLSHKQGAFYQIQMNTLLS